MDEFCPDGDGLDKSFLDDTTDNFTPTNSTEPNDHPDSDSDSEAKHNPLVSRFDDDCLDAPGSPKNEQRNEEKLKKNPLSKKSSAEEKTFGIPLEEDPETIVHQSSLSSLDIENSYTNFSIDGYDTWSLDTKLRRSPEGGEDIESTVSSLHVVQDADPVDMEKKPKEKDKEKKKKKKKDKDKDEHREKKKKDKKKKDNVEDFLNEMKCNPVQQPDVNSLDDEAYEAI